MGFLSYQLKAHLKSAHVDEKAPIAVVVCLRKEAEKTMHVVGKAAKVLGRAKELLRASGLGGAIMKSPTFRPRSIFAGLQTAVVNVTVGELEKLAKSPGVEYVRPVRIHHAHLDTSVGLLGVDASVRSSWDGGGLRVAIIDSGIDASHPDLKGRVNLELSRNFTDEGDADDVHDGNGHGTHVAGIVGGAGDTYKGVAPAVEFIACKVFTSAGTGAEGAVLNAVRWAVEKKADVINYSGGFAPVDEEGEAVIAPPWVWPLDLQEEEVEFTSAMDAGVVSVISAGNEGELGRNGTLSLPATCQNVITVGALDKDKKLTSFSSVGPAYRSSKVSPADMVKSLTATLRLGLKSFPKVDLVTPGGGVDREAALAGGCFYAPGIISTLAKDSGEAKPACIVDERYVRLSGTSQAAPHLAGLAALVLQAAIAKEIDLGAKRAYAVKGILMEACKKVAQYKKAEQGSGLPAWSTVEGILDKIKSGDQAVSDFTG